MKQSIPAHDRPRAHKAHEVPFPSVADPTRSAVFAHNELVIAAPAERIWPWLVRAARWSEFYANASDIQIEGGDELALRTRFRWKTFGTRVESVVEDLVPFHRLGWSGKGTLGFAAYHGWVLTPVVGGTRVVTEETQRGLVASMARAFLRRGLLKWHQIWLEGLARVSAEGAGKE